MIFVPPIIEWTDKRSFGSFSTLTKGDANSAVGICSGVLEEAGWQFAGIIQATSILSVFYMPAAPFWPPLPRAGAFDNYCTVDGVQFNFYDPRIDATPVLPNVVWVQKGIPATDSPAGEAAALLASYSNLAGAIALATTFIAEVQIESSRLVLLSKLPGHTGNMHQVVGNGNGCSASDSTYGGWLMKSPGGAGSKDMVVRIQLGDQDTMMWAFITGEGASELQLDAQAFAEGTNDERYANAWHCGKYEWIIYADPNQVLISPNGPDDAVFHAGDIYVFNSAAWFCSPSPGEGSGISSSAFLVRNFGRVRQSLANHEMVTEVNGGVYANNPGAGTIRFGQAMLVRHNPEGRLRWWNEMTDARMYQDAYVMLSPAAGAEYRIIGRIRNCFMDTEAATPGGISTFDADGIPWNAYVLAAQAGGTPATLYVMLEEQET